MAGLGEPVQAPGVQGFIFQPLDGDGAVAECGVVVKIAGDIAASILPAAADMIVGVVGQQRLGQTSHGSNDRRDNDHFKTHFFLLQLLSCEI